MRFGKRMILFAKKLASRRNLLYYKLYGQRPWTRGYFEYKWQLIEEILSGEKILADFKGERVDERLVEYLWLMENLPEEQANLLDAGSALNFEIILNQHKLSNKKITIVNLNPEKNCFARRGVSYLYEDLRNLPFKSDYFDIITCISTLEHIGMDNTKIYTVDPKYKENKVGDYLVVATELKRILKPGGSLFITVPFGKYRDFGFFQQFDQDMINRLESLFGTDKCIEAYYKYAEDGWQISSQSECASAEYVLADKARVSTLGPAAASAVACLKLTK
jgi:SAM-dependent methyltransferase